MKSSLMLLLLTAVLLFSAPATATGLAIAPAADNHNQAILLAHGGAHHRHGYRHHYRLKAYHYRPYAYRAGYYRYSRGRYCR